MSQALGYKTTNRIPVGFYFAIFILFLNSMKWWLGWEGRWKYIDLVTLSFLLFSLWNYPYIKFCFNRRNLFLALTLSFSYIGFGEFAISKVTSCVVFFIICCLRRDFQVQCLQYIFKWFAWLMIPSIIVYFFAQAGIMPSFGTLHTIENVNETYFKLDYVTRVNYVFYCYSHFYEIRFNGPFIEPGHLGMMVAFLLFADGFDFKKKESYILLFAIVLSMSLSGILLTFFGYIFTKYEQRKIQLSFIVIFGFGILLFYLIGTFYNDGDNLINEWVLKRLEYDEEKGISGNNRVFGQIDLYYAAMFNDIHTLLYGYDNETIEYLAWHKSRGTGFVMCMVVHGLIGTIVGIIFYVFYSLSADNKRTAMLFLAFVLMLYWQRTYPFWYSWIICFVFGISKRSFTIYENRNFNVSPQPQLRGVVAGNCIA